MRLIVMAKEPRAGRVKTRLCPPYTPADAAAIAEAALADTLEAAVATGADEVVLALDGHAGPWCPAGVRVVAQVDGPFDARLAAAWEAAGGPAVQIGMDTPQVTAGILDDALATLGQAGVDAVLGPAIDGGWWAIGLRRADARVFAGVPMSRPDTGRLQAERLRSLGLSTCTLATLRDVDSAADAEAVALAAPSGRFAAAVTERRAAVAERDATMGKVPAC